MAWVHIQSRTKPQQNKTERTGTGASPTPPGAGTKPTIVES
jgi:hypothetical protein